MGWEIIFVVLALLYAMKKGAAHAWQRFQERRAEIKERKAHKSQLVTEALADDVAPRAAKRAAKTGASAAVSVTTLEAIWIAFKDAWREGWQEGHQRGEQLRDRSEPDIQGDRPPSASASCRRHFAVTAAKREKLLFQGLCVKEVRYETCPVGHQIPTYCGRASGIDSVCDQHRIRSGGEKNGDESQSPTEHAEDLLCPAAVSLDANNKAIPCRKPAYPDYGGYCWEHRIIKATTSNEPKEHHEMPIETSTGGEILTKEQFVGEMNSIIQEETGELEDAQGDLKRAEEHMKRVEVMAASLASAEIDRETVSQVRVFIDSNSTRRQLASQRVAAAEQRKANAEAALETLNRSLQNNFYAS